MIRDMALRFPNESTEYRTARDELLRAEVSLRRQIADVAARRRALPLGGVVKEDYVFEEMVEGQVRSVRLSQLFGEHDSLFLYGFMFGPRMENACPSCSSVLDALDGNAKHLAMRLGIAVVARSPIDRVAAFASARGWRNLRLLSSAHNSFQPDYFAETDQGGQMPMANVFVRRGGRIHHQWGSEGLYEHYDDGEPRHVDFMWPLWNVLDLTPEGRGVDWNPPLAVE